MQTSEQAGGQTNVRILYARPAELRAIDEVVQGYLHILSVTRLPDEYARLFALLYAFRQHYWPLLEQKPQGEALLSIETTAAEMIAFGGAILHYGQFWYGNERAWQTVRLAFQVYERYGHARRIESMVERYGGAMSAEAQEGEREG
jgi:hypothetical protein